MVTMPQALVHLAVAVILTMASGCAAQSPSASAPDPIGPGASRDPDSPYETTIEEFFLQTKTCVEEQGFPVTIDIEERSFSFDLGTDARARQAREALRECQQEIDPRRLEPPAPLTDEQFASWYDYVLSQTACLRDAGYPVGDPPPEQVFIDSEAEWDPYEELALRGAPPSQEDLERCRAVEERPAFLDW